MAEERKENQAIEEDREKPEEQVEEPAVSGEEKDLVMRLVLKIKKAAGFLLRPLWKAAVLFLAPLWKPFKKGAKGVTRRDWLMFLGMVGAVAVIIAAPVLLMKMQNTYKEEERMYSVILGKKVYWDSGTFEINDQNQVKVFDSQGEERNSSGQPFYYEGQDVMFWPFYGLWYSVTSTDCKRVERFSRIQYEYGKGCFIQKGDGQEIVLPGFLYDNQNTYVVLENAKLYCGGEERNLPPLSYVRLYTNNSMDVYCYGQERGEVITADGQPEIVFGNGARIDLKGDLMYFPNGTYQLVFGVLDYYDPVGE